jgi:hypothetical protein
MKRIESEDVLKIDKYFLYIVYWVLQEYKFSPEFLSYLTGHRRGAPTALTQNCIDCLN